ncbi:MAG: PACE efflux transporter [Rhodocyclaceae bacterium]|nr:PACE efflux transporter [Rhodocyclaceae bacterium]
MTHKPATHGLLGSLQGARRRVLYVSVYEFIAITLSAIVFAALGQSAMSASALSVITSATAIAWNLAFNAMFEAWERRQSKRGRSVARRVAHAIGFEGGLALMLVPFMAWWLGITLWQALLLDVGLLLFFLAYTFVFAWVFDHLFGLPAAAA